MKVLLYIFSLYSLLAYLFFYDGHIKKDQFFLELHLVLEQDDEVQLYYKSSAEAHFQEENSFKKTISGQPGIQIVRFDVDTNTTRGGVRIDISRNIQQKTVLLDDLRIGIGKWSQSLIKSFDTVFVANAFIKKGTEPNLYLLQEDNNRFDPYFICHDFSQVIEAYKAYVSKRRFNYFCVSIAAGGLLLLIIYLFGISKILTPDSIGLYLIWGISAVLLSILLYRLISIPKIWPTDLFIEFEVNVSKKDVLQVYWLPDREGARYTEDLSMQVAVTEVGVWQNIRFTIGDTSTIRSLRFDVSKNPEQGDILIRSVRVGNSHTARVVPIDSFHHFFKGNVFIQSAEEGKISTREVEGTYSLYDPFFIWKDFGSWYYPLLKPIPFIPFSFLLSVALSLSITLFLFRLFQHPGLKLGSNLFYVGCFLLLIFLPSISSLLGWETSNTDVEKRKKAQRPVFAFDNQFPDEFESYYSDNFGLRSVLVNNWSKLKIKVFNASSKPDKVLVGKDQMLFFHDMDERIYPSYARADLLDDRRLDNHVNKLINRLERLRQDSILYLYGYSPNKPSIYPERRPWVMQKQVRDTLSHIDQVKALLFRKSTRFPWIFIDEHLLKHKQDGLPLYYNYDSHWNQYGAYLAYTYFFQEANEYLGIDPTPLEDFTIEKTTRSGGDLINMLGIYDVETFKETYILIQGHEPGFTLVSQVPGLPPKTMRSLNPKAKDKRKVLIFRDSFFTSLIPYFANHFTEIIYVWKDYDQQIVDQVQPDVVIDLLVERWRW